MSVKVWWTDEPLKPQKHGDRENCSADGDKLSALDRRSLIGPQGGHMTASLSPMLIHLIWQRLMGQLGQCWFRLSSAERPILIYNLLIIDYRLIVNAALKTSS